MIFLHIHKTAGSFFKHVLWDSYASRFKIAYDINPPDKYHLNMMKFLETKSVDDLEVPENKDTIVFGHQAYMYKNLVNGPYAVMFRDPIQRTLSHYYHAAQKSRLESTAPFYWDSWTNESGTISANDLVKKAMMNDENSTLLQFLKYEYYWGIVHVINHQRGFMQLLTPNVEDFAYIGIQEDLERSVRLFYAMWPPESRHGMVNTLMDRSFMNSTCNVTKNGDPNITYHLGAREEEYMRSLLESEYELYNKARSIYCKILKEYKVR